MSGKVLSKEELTNLHRYWQAANYLSVGQIYLYDNPLLRRPLEIGDVKPRLLGHWGTAPGLNFLYVHLNRIISREKIDLLFVTGPGHGAPAVVANVYLEGTYSELYPKVTQDEQGMKKLFQQFSFPGGIPSHTAAETPGSIHEGGELGYCLAHAYGAVFDHPDLIAVCVVGDGEAETGPLAASWHSNKFLNPVHDGAVLPILHLNGYKIAQATLLARISREELTKLFEGYGYTPYFVEGEDPLEVHQQLAGCLDHVFAQIRHIQEEARERGFQKRPLWPMIIFRTPKGWTCPKEIDGLLLEGTWRAHQVPFAELREKPNHLQALEKWMRSYEPETLFDASGRLESSLVALIPPKEKRMGASPYANGGVLLNDLEVPDFTQYALPIDKPGQIEGEATRTAGLLIRDVMRLSAKKRNFRLFGPDETKSNRLGSVFDVTPRVWSAEILPTDEALSPEGRVMEVLSEHLCEGWLEGYLLTGRHGLFSCYEAFIHIIDSMFNQHAKWLKSCKEIPWRQPVASLNYLLTSHVWRQDHNGFSHQDPGFIDHILNKKADIIRIYLPPDANTLLSVMDHCLRSRDYINLMVAGKQKQLQWLDIESAKKHCEAGLGIWKWASNDEGNSPDVVMACCGDVPTLETLAAVDLLRQHCPQLKVRVVNVVDLMSLQPRSEHPHGWSDEAYNEVFPQKTQVIFAFHGYPSVIHRLTYRRVDYPYMHVRGYKEEGTTTTPFDMTVRNDLDRYHLVHDVLDRLEDRIPQVETVRAFLHQKLREHKKYVEEHGEDLPEIQNWVWPYS